MNCTKNSHHSSFIVEKLIKIIYKYKGSGKVGGFCTLMVIFSGKGGLQGQAIAMNLGT